MQRAEDDGRSPASDDVIVSARGLLKVFEQRGLRRPGKPREVTRAVDAIDLDIRRGETLGLVGESGSGKTTLGRMIAGLEQPSAGSIHVNGDDWTEGRRSLRDRGRTVQMVFQEPYSALNPRITVGDSIAEGLVVHKLISNRSARDARVRELLDAVGLRPDAADRFPDEFSGGQQQRVVIARALALEPAVLVCDEPVSALDVSVQAQIIELLQHLQTKLDITLLFIAHDLSVVRELADRVAVMYFGQILEIGASEKVFQHPLNPYTKALLSAAPVPDPDVERERERIVLVGELPTAAEVEVGCVFATRCWMVEDRCKEQRPPLYDVGQTGQRSRCHFADRL